MEKYLRARIEEDGAVHVTLLDPENVNPRQAVRMAEEAEAAGSVALLLGGSTLASSKVLDAVAERVKRAVKIPVILFPGNITGVSRFADAILFLSLLNSSNPYFLVGAQSLAAPMVKKFGLEAIPSGYIIMGEGGAAGFVGYARPIPYDRGEVAASYALAAQYLGMHLVYLEAGSGAREPIPSPTIRTVKRAVDIPLIVGGGIRSGSEARSAVEAGASIIVTSSILEGGASIREKVAEIVAAVRNPK